MVLLHTPRRLVTSLTLCTAFLFSIFYFLLATYGNSGIYFFHFTFALLIKEPSVLDIHPLINTADTHNIRIYSSSFFVAFQ